MLLLAKILISITTVLGLVFISERVSPKWGGLLAGLPLGTGIFIFFYSIEQGIEFTRDGIPFGIASLAGSMALNMGFYLGAKISQQKFWHIFSASFFGIAAFFIVSFVISQFKISLLTGIILFLIATALSILFFRHVEEHKGHTPAKVTLELILFRCIFIVTLVLTITTIAAKIGPEWSGIFASFPVNGFPLYFILAFHYGDKLYPVVFKHLSYSFSNLCLFYLLVFWLFPILGVYWGILASYSLCFGYLFLLSKVKSH